MSLNNSIITQSIGIPYQQYVTSSAGHTLVSSSTYFNDTSDNIPRYKDASGNIYDVIISSSYALTASHALNSGGDAFPFTGDAQITGSLTISGSFSSFTLDSDNIVLGAGAGGAMEAGANSNVIIGPNAGAFLTTGDHNVMVGDYAGQLTTTTSKNVFVGEQAGRNNTGYQNIFLGYRAGRYDSGGINNKNIAIGDSAFMQLTGDNDATNCIAIGYQAGYRVKDGSNNILLGEYAGGAIVDSGNNIIIGSGSAGETTTEAQLRIGHASLITISASLATGDLIFASTASAAYFVGDGRNLTNLPASDPFPYSGSAIISSSGATASLTLEGSGSTIFSIQGSQGQLFSVTDDLLDEVFSVADISGDTLLSVSGSGLVEIPVGDLSGSATSTASFGTYLAGNISASGEIIANSLNVIHLTSSFITSSTIQSSGSHIFGDEVTDTQTLVGTIKMSGSANLTGSLNVDGNVVTSTTGKFIGPLEGTATTASYVENAQTASYVETSEYTTTWSVVNASGGSSYYNFTGNGVGSTDNNPDIYLTRGEKYLFNVNASGHPFQIRVANGGAAYNDGVTGNATSTVIFDVQFDAPTHLYYQCTNHGGMVGNIYIADARIASGSFSGSFQGDGSNLTNVPATAFPFTGDAQLTGSLLISGSTPKIEFDEDIIIQQPSSTSGGIRIGYNAQIYEASQPEYSVVIGHSAKDGPSSGTNYDQSISIGRSSTGGYYAVAIGGLADAGSTGAVAIGAAAVANGNYGISIGNGATTAASAISIGKGATGGTNQGTITIGTNTTNNKQNSIVLNATTAVATNGSHKTFATYMSNATTPDFTIVHDGTSFMTGTGKFEFRNTGGIVSTGSLTVSGSVVDFTDATAISGSTFSGSFVGNGSGISIPDQTKIFTWFNTMT